MVFLRPTLETLKTRSRAEIASRLGLEALQPRSLLEVIADVLAGSSHHLHGRLDYVSQQIHIATADAEHLDAWAGVFEVLRKAAEYSSGPVTFTGSNGVTIPIGTRVRYAETGIEYETTAAGTIAGGSVELEVVALVAGLAGDVAEATSLVLSASVVGVDDTATVGTGGLTGGADQEDDEDLRARLLQAIQNPFQGGSTGNYVGWATAVPLVTRAWCLPNHLGLGTVGVTFVLDDDPVSIVPGSTKVAEVQAAIDLLRPVGANVTVFAPGLLDLDPEIQLTPNTAQVQQAVTDSLEDMIRRETEPGGTLKLSKIREAISTAEGEEDSVLVSPVADVVAAGGQIHNLGTITWS